VSPWGGLGLPAAGRATGQRLAALMLVGRAAPCRGGRGGGAIGGACRDAMGRPCRPIPPSHPPPPPVASGRPTAPGRALTSKRCAPTSTPCPTEAGARPPGRRTRPGGQRLGRPRRRALAASAAGRAAPLRRRPAPAGAAAAPSGAFAAPCCAQLLRRGWRGVRPCPARGTRPLVPWPSPPGPHLQLRFFTRAAAARTWDLMFRRRPVPPRIAYTVLIHARGAAPAPARRGLCPHRAASWAGRLA
jgi:hypothetical protein